MHGELAPLGIHVTVIEPGGFRTDFLDGSSLTISDSRIEDYDGTAGGVRQWAVDTNHAQLGDPEKLAAGMIALVNAVNPPMRMPFGSDTVRVIEEKIGLVQGELAQWRELALSTDHQETIDA